MAIMNISSAGRVTFRTSTLECLQISGRISKYGKVEPEPLYVTIFSNASRDIYEQNMHADFMVKLAQPVDLGSTSNWEVGLFEISC